MYSSCKDFRTGDDILELITLLFSLFGYVGRLTIYNMKVEKNLMDMNILNKKWQVAMQKQNKMISKLPLMREPKGLISIKNSVALPHHPNPSKMKEPMTLQKLSY